MIKYILITSMLLSIFSCGQKSEIKEDVKAETLACAYGDCKHIIYDLSFPLDDPSFAFETPLLGLGPIAGGIVKFVGDIFAKTKEGRVEFQLIQPIPVVPEKLHSVRVNRLFLYMKPKKPSGLDVVEEEEGFIWNRIRRYGLGKGITNFDFMETLGVRISAAEIDRTESYSPIFREGFGTERTGFMRLFQDYHHFAKMDPETEKEMILVKYMMDTKAEDTINKKFGRIHYLETTKDPSMMKKLFEDSKEFEGHYKRIVLLRDSILIELNKDPVANEVFKFLMSKYNLTLKELGLTFVDTCSVKKCLELRLSDVNLVPVAKKGNALKLDALLQAYEVPESFKLKGFAVFEVKVQSDT